MLNFESADDFQSLVATLAIITLAEVNLNKAKEVAAPGSWPTWINGISWAYEDLRTEIKENLSNTSNPHEAKGYLETVREMLDGELLGQILQDTKKTHAELVADVGIGESKRIALSRALIMCHSIQEEPSEHNIAQRKKAGQYYLIASKAYDKSLDLLREIDRQLMLLAHISVKQPPILSTTDGVLTEPIEQPPTADYAVSLEGLLSFGVQPIELAKLISQTLFHPNSVKPLPNPKLRVFAIVYALKFHKVVKLSAPALAALIGKAWGVEYGPRLNNKGPVYDELFEPLRNDVLQMKTTAKARPQSPKTPA